MRESPTVAAALRLQRELGQLAARYPRDHPSRAAKANADALVDQVLKDARRALDLADCAAGIAELATGLLGHLVALASTESRGGLITAEDLRHPRELAERIREILGRLAQAHRPDNQEV